MALLEPLSFECTSNSDDQTHRLGMRLGGLLPKHAVIALHGPMGAGKTTFARGLGAGWGADQLLRSPTFTLVQLHHRPQDGATLYHIDLYRAETETDLASLGLSEILDDTSAVSIIEWPEHAQDHLPKATIHVKLAKTADTKRQFTFSTQDSEPWQVLLKFRKNAFGV